MDVANAFQLGFRDGHGRTYFVLSTTLVNSSTDGRTFTIEWYFSRLTNKLEKKIVTVSDPNTPMSNAILAKELLKDQVQARLFKRTGNGVSEEVTFVSSVAISRVIEWSLADDPEHSNRNAIQSLHFLAGHHGFEPASQAHHLSTDRVQMGQWVVTEVLPLHRIHIEETWQAELQDKRGFFRFRSVTDPPDIHSVATQRGQVCGGCGNRRCVWKANRGIVSREVNRIFDDGRFQRDPQEMRLLAERMVGLMMAQGKAGNNVIIPTCCKSGIYTLFPNR